MEEEREVTDGDAKSSRKRRMRLKGEFNSKFGN